MEWHLDGWDRAGGRAFASLRPRNAELFDQEKSWGPMIYVGPPSFRPEPIANSAVALAASRAGVFQARVPFAGDEIGFPSAEAVADFVRRAFVNGGTTRDGGEGAPAVEGGPREPPAGGDGEAFMRSEYLEQWKSAARQLPLGKKPSALPIQFAMGIAPRAKDGREWRAVESGALQLIVTMIHSFPGVSNRHAFEQWHTPAVALYRAVQEMGFWLEWKQGVAPLDLGQDWRMETAVAALFKKSAYPAGVPPTLHVPLFVGWLLSSSPAYVPGTPDAAENYLQALRMTAETSQFVMFVGQAPDLHDRYSAVLRWPLPTYVRQYSGLRNVGQLLMAFVSSPGGFTRAHPRLLDIVAFAAALLSSRLEDRRIDDWRERAASHWLAASMPKWVFSEEAEQLILEENLRRQMAHA